MTDFYNLFLSLIFRYITISSVKLITSSFLAEVGTRALFALIVSYLNENTIAQYTANPLTNTVSEIAKQREFAVFKGV